MTALAAIRSTGETLRLLETTMIAETLRATVGIMLREGMKRGPTTLHRILNRPLRSLKEKRLRRRDRMSMIATAPPETTEGMIEGTTVAMRGLLERNDQLRLQTELTDSRTLRA